MTLLQRSQGFSLALALVFILALSLVALAAVQLVQVESLVTVRLGERLQAEVAATWGLVNAERQLQALPAMLWTQSTKAPEYRTHRLNAKELGLDAEAAKAVFIYRIQSLAQVGKNQVQMESLFALKPHAQRLSWKLLK